ncbi:MAG: hypothetical protein RL226_312, partial [Bacteroidota bacterium]
MRSLTFLLITNVLLLPSLAFSQVYGTPIITWDFADGIPSGWENGSASGIGIWEYRGPQTTPDNTVCSQGSCGATSVPIASETTDNGFVIFDSNYWDDPNGPCGNLGSGSDPGPHQAWLVTAPVNLTGYNLVTLTFQQQFKHYQCTTTVYVSNNGGTTWTQVHQNTGNNTFSPPSQWVSINVSSLAANQSDFRVKFEFSGNYYFWCLDDITLFVPSNNDLLMNSAAYTQYNGSLPPSGLGDMEYNDYPVAMMPSFKFSSRITNVGGMLQNNVLMNVKVFNGEGTELYNGNNSQAVNVSPGAVITPSIFTPYVPPTIVDDYSIRFAANQTQADETPTNNIIIKDFRITPYTYGRDEGALEDTFIPAGIYENEAYELGNVFEGTVTGVKCHSIAVAFAEPTIPGTQVYGIIYNMNRSQILGTTDMYTINPWDINQEGEERMIHLELTEDMTMYNDSGYVVMVGYNHLEGEGMFLGRSGASPVQSSLIAYPNLNGLFYMLRTPMVRMDVFAAAAVPGCTDANAMNFEPEADTDDGSCRYPGCIDPLATNYDPTANFGTDTCLIEGCTDPEAANFSETATVDDGSCQYPGCTDENATNFNPDANVNDGSCTYNDAFISSQTLSGCTPLALVIDNQTVYSDNSTCLLEVFDENGGLIATFDTCADDWSMELTEIGTYSAEFTYTSNEFESSYTLTGIQVFALPAVPTFSFNEPILACDGCDGLFVSWYLDGELLEETSSSWEPTLNGNYSVEVTTEQGCSAVSESTYVQVVSVEETSVVTHVWPNPVQTTLYLSSGTVPITALAMYNAQGQLV